MLAKLVRDCHYLGYAPRAGCYGLKQYEVYLSFDPLYYLLEGKQLGYPQVCG